MSTSANEIVGPIAAKVAVTDATLAVDLSDGRTISVPTSWYPRLAHATHEERREWQLIGAGVGIHWPSIDEDVSIEALLKGDRSKESATSLKRWLAQRQT
jgi:hypothetical protein